MLAEFMGIVFGDGGINNDWQLVISLNSLTDREYSDYILKLIYDLFHIKAAIRKRPNQNTLVIVCSSTSLVDFLVEQGAVKGNKITKQIDIPNWVSSNSLYSKFFVRGLIDTDGCLYTHKHKCKGKEYMNIGLCFTSFSENLTSSVAIVLKKFNIVPHVKENNHRIYLYSRQAVVKYLKSFGSSNSRIKRKYWDFRRDAGVAERTRLESVHNRKIIAGSNPALSALLRLIAPHPKLVC